VTLVATNRPIPGKEKTMKKIVLTALSLAFCAAVSAHAFQEPQWGQRYQCFAFSNSGNGIFTWAQRTRTGRDSNLIIWGSESLNSQNPYKANWAKPTPLDQNNPNGSTVWEFTLPGVAQCTKVIVYPSGNYISFQQCNDTGNRFCQRG
jgi:hypothetical protein